MLSATNLPRTAVSATNAAETKTATLARREMQSWKLLQLQPSSLRAPDPFTAPTKLANRRIASRGDAISHGPHRGFR